LGNWPKNLIKPREVQDSDHPAILAALRRNLKRLAQERPECAAMRSAIPEIVLGHLMSEAEAAIVGDYFVVVQQVDSWWMPDARYLQEELVLRISDEAGTRLRSVVRVLEHCARQVGCVGILVGTFGDSTGALAKAYQRLGFKPTPAQLYKELNG